MATGMQDLNDLYYFARVVEYGGFAPAARALDMHKSKLSRRIALLEDRLGVRLIEGPLAGVRTPVFQTSANRSGEAAAHRLCDVDSELIAAADLAIDGGELFGEPSTVLDLTGIESGDPWQVLREGALAATDIRRLLAGLTD